MKADYLSYKRATTVSLLGLALQLGMGIALLIYAVVARNADGRPSPDHLALTCSYFVLAGSLVWLMLAILFDQHRRERIEDLEAQALTASGARESSVFNEGTDDFRVAAKRLAWMHRILVPSVSILYALLLVGVGFWRFSSGKQFLDPDKFASAGEPGWPIGIGIGVALVGFFFARYAAGMAKQAVWANLRGGAAVSVGAALFGLALAVGHLVDKVGPTYVLQYLHIIIPALMMVLAAEVAINFILSIYSPRRPGEYPRPAFDSRVLGFVAAPDKIAESIGEAINYQFGFDVTSSWFYQLLSRSILTLGLTAVAVLWLLTAVTIVQPNEQGIRVRLGRLVTQTPLEPGPYFKLPWPFERIERFQTTVARRVALGGDSPKLQNKAILWTNDHGVSEAYFVVQPSAADRRAAAGEELAPVARDFSLISAEIPLIYTINDLVKFEALGAPDQREQIIRAIGRREAFRIMATETVDRALGDGRQNISAQLRASIETELNKLDAGVRILFVGIEGVHPPRDTAAAFEGVVQGRQMREGAIQTAQSEANDKLISVAGSVKKAQTIAEAINALAKLRSTQVSPADRSAHEQKIAAAEREIQDLLAKAGGTAASTILTARSDRWVKHMEARGRAESYVGQTAGFREVPEVFTAQQYFAAVKGALGQSRVYIVSGDGNVEVRANLEDISTGGSMFGLPKKEEE